MATQIHRSKQRELQMIHKKVNVFKNNSINIIEPSFILLASLKYISI